MVTTIYLPGDRPYLVVECDSPVAYSNQVGGVACMHPQVQGVLLPDDLDWTGLEGIACGEACGGAALMPALADRMEAAWPEQWDGGWMVALDRDRLYSGTEAFYPVRFYAGPRLHTAKGHADEILLAEWLNGRTGWLFMHDNCD